MTPMETYWNGAKIGFLAPTTAAWKTPIQQARKKVSKKSCGVEAGFSEPETAEQPPAIQKNPTTKATPSDLGWFCPTDLYSNRISTLKPVFGSALNRGQ